MISPIYLDNHATTPCDPLVVDAMMPYFSERFGNAASTSHSYGMEAKAGTEHARAQMAALIGASPFLIGLRPMVVQGSTRRR